MKAEHRKELQTNILADRMGRMLDTVKTRPSRRGVLLVLLILVVIVGGGIAYVVYQGGINDNRQRWVEFDKTVDFKTLQDVAKDYEKTNQGKAARAQIAWVRLWELGIKRMGIDTNGGVNEVVAAKEMFSQLADDCKDDPVLGAEAVYAIAVCEETLACSAQVSVKAQLDQALKAYRRVVDEHEKSGYAIKAAERIKLFESENERELITRFYEQIQTDANRLKMFHEQLGPLMKQPRK